MEMEKDIWGGSWSPEIESRIANSIWEEKYRVSFELIDSSEEPNTINGNTYSSVTGK